MYRPTIIGIDPSLEATGFAGIEEGGAGQSDTLLVCQTFGRKGKRNATMSDRHQRILDLVENLRAAIFDLNEIPALAVMEDFPHGVIGGSTFDRIGLYWRIYEVLTDLTIPVAMVNVAKVKQFATGAGSGPNADKDHVLLATVRRYPAAPINNNNEADAFTLAAMGAYGLGYPLTAVPIAHLMAFEPTKSQPSFADQLIEIGAVKKS